MKYLNWQDGTTLFIFIIAYIIIVIIIIVVNLEIWLLDHENDITEAQKAVGSDLLLPTRICSVGDHY